jgi:hypothetical protein
MFTDDTHKPASPNLEFLVNGLRGIDDRARGVGMATPVPDYFRRHPVKSEILHELLEEAVKTTLNAQTRLFRRLRRCLIGRPWRMRRPRLHRGYVECHLVQIRQLIEEIVASRDFIASVAVRPSGESIRGTVVDCLDAYLRQFKDFANELPGMVAREARSVQDLARIAPDSNAVAELRSLRQSLEDTVVAQRRRVVAAHAKGRHRALLWIWSKTQRSPLI